MRRASRERSFNTGAVSADQAGDGRALGQHRGRHGGASQAPAAANVQAGRVPGVGQELEAKASKVLHKLKGLWKRLKELRGKELKRDDLLLKLGAAKNLYPSAWCTAAN